MENTRFRWAACFALSAFLMTAACATTQQNGVLVDVTVPPQVDLKALSGDINTINVRGITGDGACAGPLKTKISSIIVNADIFKKEIAGFEEGGSASVDVTGIVDKCSVEMGHGALSANFSLVYNGQVWRTFIVNKDTNRPGASEAEVRDVLVDRVARAFVSMFIPTTRQEVRVFKPVAPDDKGITAAMSSNWDMAVQLWTKRINQFPKDHNALYNRGVAWEARGDLRKAMADYKRAADNDKDPLYVESLARAENALKASQQKEKMKE